MIKLTRRAMMMAAAASGLPSLSWAESRPAIHVVEGSGCECCKQWTNYLRENGFQVTSEERFGTLLMQHKIDLGVPIELTSCHTGSVDGYFLEGHVPADDIRRLLRERLQPLQVAGVIAVFLGVAAIAASS